MGCFKICFGTCKDKRLVRFEPLKPTKPVVHVSKSVIFEFNCRNKNDILVDHGNKENESEINNVGNRKCTILANEKEENFIGIDKFLDYSLSKLEGHADLEGQDESTESLNIAKIGDLLEESSDKQLNGLYNVGQVLQEEFSDSVHSVSNGQVNGSDDGNQLIEEESSDSLFSVSVGSKKKENAAENDDVHEESSDSLFSVSVEPRKHGSDNVDQLAQEESSDSLFSVSVGSKKKVNVAENCDVLVQEESSDSLFSVSIESRKKLDGWDNVDQFVQEEYSDSLFSVSVGSKKKACAAENGNVLVQEESFDSLFSVSFESRNQVNAVETDENEVNSPIAFGLKHSCKHHNSSPTLANSILGPIENLTNRKKGIKVASGYTCIELKDYEKENMSSVPGLNLIPFSIEEPSLIKLNTISKQQKGSHLKARRSSFAVDTSLSSWLAKSDGETSEDTPILAAFTCEELKQHCFTSSTRRPPSRNSSDELLIIGTAGSYSSYTGNIKNSSNSNSPRVQVQQSS